MDTTSPLLHKEYPKQPHANLTSAKHIKKLLSDEQVTIEDQFNAIKADIFLVVSQSIQRREAQVTPAPPPGITATVGTPPPPGAPPPGATKLPYILPDLNCIKKCESFKYSFNPREVDIFFIDHYTATKAQFPRDWQAELVSELHHKLDAEWRALSVS